MRSESIQGYETHLYTAVTVWCTNEINKRLKEAKCSYSVLML